MKDILCHVISVANLLALAWFCHFLYEMAPIDTEDMPLVAGIALLLLGNAYVCFLKGRKNFSCTRLADVWPFIIIQRITLEEKNKIRRILQKSDAEK
ncbi:MULTISPECIES: hypothetical protein [unclassified Desulfovibrio]|uniref:hypothetical protein n=1 Tax=unclassified Desulfovibrio TaxID=2593640 RepID=UPI000F5F753D|nr:MULTISPECIES: hypothetical protein [unclassified Desulfovibrio]RRD70245.1 hypothetical protein EII24_07125 [Desulfovibrio sp. OH1209_COT-279]RRD86762.1 hypothetical protein EII23_07125 [Desulfovibrio sp. OH1186_COT-070]